MPPRSGKRRAAGPGSRRAVRGRGASSKAQTRSQVQPQVEESTLKVDEEIEVPEVVKVEEVVRVEETVDEVVLDKDSETVETVGISEAIEDKDTEGAVKMEDPILEKKEEECVEPVEEEEVLEERKIETLEKVEDQKQSENEDDPINRHDYTKEANDDSEKDEKLDLEDNDPDYEPEDYGGVYYDEREMEQEPHELGHIDEDRDEALEGEDEGNAEHGIGINDELEHEEDGEHAGMEHAEMADAVEDDHTEVFKERRKRKEFEIFVGGLDKDATESDLRKVFSEVGEVTEVRLMMNPQTKKNKGFAFLRFATVEQAKRACIHLKNPLVRGKPCGVTPSQDSDTLFVGNISRTWTKEALKEKLESYGVETVEDLTLVENRSNTGMNRGFAFLEFSSRADAMDAFKRLQKRDVFFGVDRPAKVSFADSFIDPGDEIMAQVKTVFLDGLSTYWEVEHVKELLKNYGKIEKVELSKDMPSARRKDFGFVTFETHDAAVLCAKSINNEELVVGDKKAKVRARLSRPLQRGKGKHTTRGDIHPGRGSLEGSKSSWSRPTARASNLRTPKKTGQRPPLPVNRGFSRPVHIRETRPVIDVPPRSRPLASLPRPHERRPPVPPYSKVELRRDYGHREELYPRNRTSTDLSFRAASERRLPYRDEFSPRASSYLGVHGGGTSRSGTRRSYSDDGYGQGYDRPPLSYREGRPREYEPMPSSKRPYTAMVDEPPRYSEAGMRNTRARLDYDIGSSAHYSDSYGDRFGRTSAGYGGSRSSMSSQTSNGLYNSHQGMGYSGGTYGGNDSSGMYSSSFSGGYAPRGLDARSSSYSSAYPGRSLGSSSYMGSNSGSYY